MKRLKIVEQIIIVLILAVLIPFSTIGIIISNISQHSIRNELSNTASLIAKTVGDTIGHYINYSQLQLNEYASAFNFIPDTVLRLKYIDEIEANTKIFKNLDIIESSQVPSKINDAEDGKMKLYSPIDEGKNFYLSAQINLDILDLMLGSENTKDRNIYVFESGTNKLILTNAPKSNAIDALSGLKLQEGEKQTIFGHKKNTPKAYYKIDNPDWFIIVDTTKKITAQTITEARYKIILALILAAVSIIFLVGLYTSYLYINIRQLFKGIQAVSQGNYDKKIHLIKRAFTPHEIVYLADEFNYMANEINISYNDLKMKNIELEKLNEFRENLVNATSHEFRTPLTSIIGYTSRLLRHDIKLDEKTKVESLKIIKQQAQRLSRMVEDLLVIPEIDSFSLKFNIQEVDLAEAIQRALDYLKSDKVEIISDISPELGYIFADEYRLEQILINIIDNAMKYSLDNAPVKVVADVEDNIPTLKVINKCHKIDDEIKEKLFEKFIRADSALTRTTRGTGLGLYIVKGLASAMNIEINFSADDEFIMELKFKDVVG